MKRICTTMMSVLTLTAAAHAEPPAAKPAETPSPFTVKREAPTQLMGTSFEATYPAGAVSLLPFGDFETPNETGDSPKGWQSVDNLVFHWTTDPAAPQRGKVMRINVDISQKQAYAWWIERYLRNAPLTAAPTPLPTTLPKYDTIAGLDGGFYWSAFFPIEKDKAYRVYVDAKGPPAKVFLKGYVQEVPLSFADENAAVQELFRHAKGEPLTDKAGRPVRYRYRYIYQTWFQVGGSDEWKTYSHDKPRHPTSRELTENVRFLRIEIYPYWPPGDYWFDNIRVIEVPVDPAQAKPQSIQADEEEGKVIR